MRPRLTQLQVEEVDYHINMADMMVAREKRSAQ